MLSEWSSECGPDDPVLVVPWQAPGSELRWVDLRDDPDALDEIAEADEHPAMLAALRALNGPRSPVFTAKCDAWAMEAEELAATRDDLLLDGEVAQAGMTSYIDLLWRERAVFASRHQMETLLYRLDRISGELHHPLSKVECVLRPAVLDLNGAIEGYAVSLYLKGVGVDAEEAGQRWSAALRDVAGLFRSRELEGL